MQEGQGKTRSGPNSFSPAPPAPSPSPFLFPSTVQHKKKKDAGIAAFSEASLLFGVDWSDCQIAATGCRGVEFLGQNVKHFTAFPGLRVVRAY